MISPEGFDIIIQTDEKEGMILGDEPVERGCFAGIYEVFAEICGVDIMLRIYSEFAGSQISFPKKLFAKEYVVNETIRAYNGTNLSKLSKKFGYSERHLRHLMKQNLEEDQE